MNRISQKTLKEVLDYDQITGLFTWRKKIADKVVVGTVAGSVRPDGYRIIRLYGKAYRAHQLAFLYMKGYFPTQVDHLNHKQDDNSWLNLEESSYKDNGKNHPLTKRNSTGVVGVSQRPDGKYVARIYVNKKHKFLGAYSTVEDAARARKLANVQYGFKSNHGVGNAN